MYYITISVRSCHQEFPSFLSNHHPLGLAFQNILSFQFLSLCVFMSPHFYCLSVSLWAPHPDELPNGHPEQKTFSDSEKEYLAMFFEEYIASSTSSSTKIKRVASNVHPKYIAKYNSAGPGGPNLVSLLTVCVSV